MNAARSWLAFVAAAAVTLTGCATRPPVAEPPPLPRVATGFTLDSLWFRQAQPTRPASYRQPGPLLFDGRIYHADRPERIIAFDARSGRELWRVDLREASASLHGADINTGLGAGEGLVFAGTRQGRVIALDAADGSLRWEAQLSSEVAAPPMAMGGLAVASSNDGRIYALDAGSGAVRWVQEGTVPPLSLRGASRPLFGDGQVYVGQASGRMIAVAAESGEVVWESAIGIAEGRSEFERLVDIDADPVLNDGTIYAAAYQARLAALSTVSGRVQWSRELSTHQPLLLSGDLLYVSTAQSEVMAVERASGAVLWRQAELAGRAITAPVMFAGMVAVADDGGYLHFLSPEDGRFVGRVRLGEAPITDAPVVADDMLYVVDAEGALQALRKGRFSLFP